MFPHIDVKGKLMGKKIVNLSETSFFYYKFIVTTNFLFTIKILVRFTRLCKGNELTHVYVCVSKSMEM